MILRIRKVFRYNIFFTKKGFQIMNKMKLIAALLLLQAGLASASNVQLLKLQKNDIVELEGVLQLPVDGEIIIEGDQVDESPVVVKASAKDLKGVTVDGLLNLIVEKDGVVLHALPVNLGDSVQLQTGAQTVIITVVATASAVVSPAVAAAVLAAASQGAALPVAPAVPAVPAASDVLPAIPAVSNISSLVPAIPSVASLPSVTNVVPALPAVSSVLPTVASVVAAVPSVNGIVSTVGNVVAQAPVAPAVVQAASQVPLVSTVLPAVAGLLPKK